MQSIPASQIVNVVPQPLSAGGTALSTLGMVLTGNARLPTNTVYSFPNAAAVATYFGNTATEYAMAQVYFTGTTISTSLPAAMKFFQYNTVAVSAFLRSPSIAGFKYPFVYGSQVVNVTVDGSVFTFTPTLNGAASPAAIVSALNTAISGAVPTIGTVQGYISGTTLTVTTASQPIVAVGEAVTGAGVASGTVITAFLSGTGGTGTYTVSPSQTVGSSGSPITLTLSPQTPVFSFDQIANALVLTSGSTGAVSTIAYATGAGATILLLNSAAGGTLSQGAAAQTPAGVLNAIIAQDTNWAGFSTAFEPTVSQKIGLAQWVAANQSYFYAMWHTEIATTQQNDTTSSINQTGGVATFSGTIPIYAPVNQSLAGAFVLGWAASLNFNRQNGRMSLSNRFNNLLQPDVTNAVTAANLQANNSNYYGAFATAAQGFVFARNGGITGPFLWADSYLDVIVIENACQLALMTLLQNAGSIPYNAQGYGQIEAALKDPMNAAINFGSARAGVTLSQQQIQTVNAAAGRPIDQALYTTGYYILVLDPGSQVRAQRGSPIITVWYTDGQTVNTINPTLVEIQ